MRQNAILDLLNQVSPESTATIIIRLKRIRESPPQEASKGYVNPTPAERVQLAANPAFGAAYANRPEEALRLLRFVNDILRKAGR